MECLWDTGAMVSLVSEGWMKNIFSSVTGETFERGVGRISRIGFICSQSQFNSILWVVRTKHGNRRAGTPGTISYYKN